MAALQSNLQFKQYPPSESELLYTSIEQSWADFVILCMRLPIIKDFAPEPAILTCIDRMTLHISGTGLIEHKFDGQTQREKTFPGSVYILPSGTPSAWRLDHSAIVLHFYFFPSLLRSMAADLCDSGLSGLKLCYLFNGRDSFIEQIGWALLSKPQTDKVLSHLYTKSLAQTLIVHLFLNYSSKPSPRIFPPGGLTSHQLCQVKDYIQERLCEDLALTELASVAGLSRSYFSEQFKLSTGFSPHQYLIRCRVERAKELLQEGRMTIAEIARQVGFADQSHLTRHFRLVLGLLPSVVLQKSYNRQKKDTNLLYNQS
jgi:AraC family transcriptional regulator